MIFAQGRAAPTAAVVGVVALLAAGCGNSGTLESVPEPTGTRTDAIVDVSASLKGSGASFPDAFYQEAVAGLGQVAPSLVVTYESVGSAAGREAFSQGLSDFAGTDSLVSAEDGIEAGSFFYIPATAASVAVVYNLPGIDDLRLDGPTLARIFQRDITRWNHSDIAATNDGIDLPDVAITVARRADGAGTTKNFTAFLESAVPDVWRLGSDDTVEWPAATQGGAQNPGVAQIVEAGIGGIGYLDFGNATELDLDMASIANREGAFVAPSVAGTVAALQGAELNDDLTYDPLDGPGVDAYPITAPTYLLVRSTYGDPTTGAGVVAFVKWLITDGADAYAADLGYAPVPPAFRQTAFDRLDTVRIG
ncbi:phosphate ABC transporter substrate-binding protein PstS [soil metagenome]